MIFFVVGAFLGIDLGVVGCFASDVDTAFVSLAQRRKIGSKTWLYIPLGMVNFTTSTYLAYSDSFHRSSG